MIRIIFLGTPDFSAPCLQTLINAPEVDIAGVLTQPDRPAGRGKKLLPTPIKLLAQEAGLTVFQPTSLKKEAELLCWLKEQQPDFFVTIAFGQILNQEILDIPKYGTVNVHASLLPLYRGANPIQQAIIDGQTETGLTTMLTDIGVDTGDMLLKKTIPIGLNDNAQHIHHQLSETAGPLLLKTLTGFVAGDVKPEPQNHALATHAPKAKKEDAALNWTASAETLHNKIRGQQPWPGAITTIQINHTETPPLKIIESCIINKDSKQGVVGQCVDLAYNMLHIQTGQGILGLKTIQPQGKKPMTIQDWLNGLQLKDWSQLKCTTAALKPVTV